MYVITNHGVPIASTTNKQLAEQAQAVFKKYDASGRYGITKISGTKDLKALVVADISGAL